MADKQGNPFARAAGTAVAAGAAAGAAYLALGNFLYGQLLSRKAATRGLNSMPKEDLLAGKASQAPPSPWERFLAKLVGEASGLGDFYEQPYFPSFQAGAKWFYDRNPEKAVLLSPRGERLHADMIRNEKPSDVWFLCLHGYLSSPRDFGGAAKVYYGWGYNILLPHLGGHGESESKAVSMGWLDRLDIVAWIDYLVRTYENPRIVLHGVSMGGATAMMTTGEALPPNVACCVEDCGYTSVWDEYAVQAKETLHMGAFPGLYALDAVVRLRSGFSLKEASCVEQVKKSKTPTLFIHGEADEFVPFWMLDEVYQAAACEKEKLAVPGAGHAESAYQKELYYGAIRAFADRYLREGG